MYDETVMGIAVTLALLAWGFWPNASRSSHCRMSRHPQWDGISRLAPQGRAV